MGTVSKHGFKPGGYEFYDVESLGVGEWCPTPDGSGPATQVHMEIMVKGMPSPLVMRFKSRKTITQLIAALTEHRDAVWP